MTLRTAASGALIPGSRRGRLSTRRGLACVRQTPYVRGEQVDLARRQSPGLRRHDVGLAVRDHGDDGVLAPAMQPDLVGEVGRADRLVALAVGAVTGRADDELRLAGSGRDRVV